MASRVHAPSTSFASFREVSRPRGFSGGLCLPRPCRLRLLARGAQIVRLGAKLRHRATGQRRFDLPHGAEGPGEVRCRAGAPAVRLHGSTRPPPPWWELSTHWRSWGLSSSSGSLPPIRDERAFLTVQQGMLFSSWGFLFGHTVRCWWLTASWPAPVVYYLALIPFMAAFVYIPGSLVPFFVCWSFAICRRTGCRPWWRAPESPAVCGLWLAWSLFASRNNELLTPDWFLEMISRLRSSESRLLPSWWLSTGLLEAVQRLERVVGANRAVEAQCF